MRHSTSADMSHFHRGRSANSLHARLLAVAGDELPRFRNRSDSVSRLEGFSDTAFGFAITLLVVSLTVPTRFQELLQQLSGLPVFAVTFALVATIWYAQYVFFRRWAERRGDRHPHAGPSVCRVVLRLPAEVPLRGRFSGRGSCLPGAGWPSP